MVMVVGDDVWWSEIDARGTLGGRVADGRAEKERGGLGFGDDGVWGKGEGVVGLDSSKRQHVRDGVRRGRVCKVEKVELVGLELVERGWGALPRRRSDKRERLEPVPSDHTRVVDVAAEPFSSSLGEKSEVIVSIAGKLEEATRVLEVVQPFSLGIR